MLFLPQRHYPDRLITEICIIETNDDNMIQTLSSDILLIKRGKSKAVTSKEHLGRNDFIFGKQKVPMRHMQENQEKARNSNCNLLKFYKRE